MAANSITALGKRLCTNRIWNSNSPSASLLLNSRRAGYSSVYDKNPDEQAHAGAVPDDVIHATQSGKYWAPHPQTGVFGPPGGTEQPTPPATTDASNGSVLEEKAWFRPTSIEDLEKPHNLP
ncbi:hypothetical protein PIB30_023814 [Stylosanthes scabra]|uniref:Late embryogenesis abundant protein At5g17165-like n=1 Tax=Stylosanthes scabra TaxID=79078 RepID=A0ABU6Z903_9FABA|nr:hypothetical protein [Stylosanthes scabra]